MTKLEQKPLFVFKASGISNSKEAVASPGDRRAFAQLGGAGLRSVSDPFGARCSITVSSLFPLEGTHPALFVVPLADQSAWNLQIPIKAVVLRGPFALGPATSTGWL